MVGYRAKRLIQLHRELLAQVTRMRLEAKEQAREEWLQRAKAQAARIANRAASPRRIRKAINCHARCGPGGASVSWLPLLHNGANLRGCLGSSLPSASAQTF